MSLFTTGIVQEFLTTHQNGRYVFQFVLSATGAGTFTVPAGVTQIDVGCWGAGACGNGDDSGSVGFQGGGGGGYAWSSITVSQGQTFDYYVAPPTPHVNWTTSLGSGATTYFGTPGVNMNTAQIRAMGGGGGGGASPHQAGGGTASGALLNRGSITFNGGNGASQVITPRASGGGGSGAGSTANGNNGSQGNGAGGVAAGGAASATLGGAGGVGYPVGVIIGTTWGNGAPGNNYGGGGGGGASAGGSNIGSGGDGAQGLIVINCIIP